jgi:hypothetical protein
MYTSIGSLNSSSKVTFVTGPVIGEEPNPLKAHMMKPYVLPGVREVKTNEVVPVPGFAETVAPKVYVFPSKNTLDISGYSSIIY